MEREKVIEILVEFFRDEFAGDPVGVGDWLAQGDVEANDVLDAIEHHFPKKFSAPAA